MTREEVDAISKARLDSWRQKLTAAHATPAVLIGIGHDDAAGEIHLCVPENLPAAFVAGLLVKLLTQLKNQG